MVTSRGQVPVSRRARGLAVLATATVLMAATWFSAAAALPGLRDELGLSPSATRLAVVAVQAGFATAAVASALAGLPERVRPRSLAATGAVAAALANAIPLAGGGVAGLIGSRLLVGGGLALVYPSVLKAAAGWADRSQGAVMGLMIGALTIGSASPHLVESAGAVSWRITLVVTSTAAVVGGVLARWATVDGPTTAPPRPFDPRLVPGIIADRRLRLACAGYLGHMWELYAGWAIVAPFAVAVLGSGSRASLLAFAIVAVGALGAWAGGRIGDDHGREATAIAAMLVSGAVVSALGFLVGSPALVLPLAIVWGVVVMTDSAQFPALVVHHAGPERAGTALTLQLALGFALTGVTMWLVPVVQAAAGWGPALACLAPGPLAGAAALARLRRLEGAPVSPRGQSTRSIPSLPSLSTIPTLPTGAAGS